MRTRLGRGGGGERGAVGLLMDLFRSNGNGDLTEEAPLMSFRGRMVGKFGLEDGQPSA